MKKPHILIGKDGFQFRSKNKRVSVIKIENHDAYQLKFENFIGSEHITAITRNERGKATTIINLRKETLFAICQGLYDLENNPELK